MGGQFGNAGRVVAFIVLLLSQVAADALKLPGGNRQVEALIQQLSDPDPAIREKAKLTTLNLSGDAYASVEAALARNELSPAARLVLDSAKPRLKVRAAAMMQQRKDLIWGWTSPESEWKRVGHKDPRWNASVEDGMRVFTRGVTQRPLALQSFKKAADAGCDDALVLYLIAASQDSGVRPAPDSVLGAYRIAANAMLASNYNAARKMIALARYFQSGADIPADIPLDSLFKWTVEASKDPSVPRNEIWTALHGLLPQLRQKLGWAGALAQLEPQFRLAFPNQWYADYFVAEFNVDWAWDARGSGTADTVTPQGWKLFEQRIEAADRALEQAWKLDPTQAAIYEKMMTICMAKSDKQGLELWFRRGIEANPDDYQLCQNKMYALEPRWLGTHEEMLAFGRDCAATHNYYGSIAHMIVNAHELISRESPDAEQYMLQPVVWSDIHKILEERLALFPTVHNRSRYVQWAARCGHWDVIASQCEILGDHPDPTVFPDANAYEAIRKKAMDTSANH